MILARTLKGKGISLIEGKGGWHGKPLKKGAELDKALAELQSQFVPERATPAAAAAGIGAASVRPQPSRCPQRRRPLGADCRRTSWATASPRARRIGDAIARLGAADDRIVALDADVKNSTFSEKFEQRHPERFYQNFIAEQVMIGAAMGLAARGAIPFPVDVRRVPDARLRLHPHGGDQQPERQDGRLARRRVDRRGRPVADGARGSGDDARASRTSPCSIRATP